MNEMAPIAYSKVPQGTDPRKSPSALMDKARELEAVFLAEMLGHGGLGAGAVFGGGYEGGAGEEQFSSFLRRELAMRISAQGGIGLAESLFRALGGAQQDAG